MKLLWQLKHLDWNVCIWNMKGCRKPRNKRGIVFGEGDWTVVAKYYSSVGHHWGLLPWFTLFKPCGDWCFPRMCCPESPSSTSVCVLVIWPVENTLSSVLCSVWRLHLELPQHLLLSLYFFVLILMSLFVNSLYGLFIHCLPHPKPTKTLKGVNI